MSMSRKPMRIAIATAVLVLSSVGALAQEAQQGYSHEALNLRLSALDADPELASHGAYERTRARQALQVLDEARSRDREAARYVAERRVAIAEIVARNQAMQAELLQLERQRNNLLVEASRRDAAQARAEVERLRLQAQMQAEEAARLREQAMAGEAAMEDVETALQGVAGVQEARLAAARKRQAALAREEAELVADAKLPPSRHDRRGDVFTVSGDASEGSVNALAAYIQAMGGNGAIRVSGKGAGGVRDALVAAGVPASRIRTSGGSGPVKVTVP